MPKQSKTPEEQQGYETARERIKECQSQGGGGISLDLSGLYLTALPAEIGQLQALRLLSLAYNQLTALPEEIGKLRALTHLLVHSNELTALPKEIGQMQALRHLSLDGNQLTALPKEIGQMQALRHLSLDGNQLTALPEEICQLQTLTELFLHGNPGLGIPDSVLGPTINKVFPRNEYELIPPARPADILNFYFAQRRAAAAGTATAINEIKVMLVGRGGAGKTSLRRFFRGLQHDSHEPETPGIALDDFPLHFGQREIKVRLWDFAGQEIAHALHQFFLTEGCVYLLVLDPRSNTEMNDAEYWLGLLRRYAAGAPVLVALNRQDARQGGYDVDRRALEEHFPFIRGFVATNCETRSGCEELRAGLRTVIQDLDRNEPPHLEVPGQWLDVMHGCATEGKQRQHLTLDEFRTVCQERGVSDAAKQELLARLLHKLGAVLHFVDDPRLRDTSVLDPHWVTDGVYRLLRHKDRPGSDGILSLADALEALPGETEKSARFLLRLMERFEMCFPVREKPGAPSSKWLVPGALNPFQPAGVGPEWQQEGGVRLRYVYDPLPEGVIPRFIVLTHSLSEGQPRWRNGVVLHEGEAAALVRRGEKRNHVEVVAFGPPADRLRLLEIVQGNLERINGDIPDPKPYAEQELQIPGRPGVYRRVSDLEAAEQAKIPVAVEEGAVKVTLEPTPQLNKTSEQSARSPERVPLEAFLSYSHLDTRAKGIFQLNLTVLQKKRHITAWHDGLIDPGMRWREEITGALEKMDVFVGLLTTAFVASAFIEEVEVAAARRKMREKGRDFLFVLILVDDISLRGLDLAEYQVLIPGRKPVCKHKSIKDGFDVAQKELEVLLARLQAEKAEKRRREEPVLQIIPGFPDSQGVSVIGRSGFSGKQAVAGMAGIPDLGRVGSTPISRALADCSDLIQQQAPGARKDKLRRLQSEARAVIDLLPPGKQEKAARNLRLIVEAATADEPDRTWYEAGTAGLIEASKSVAGYDGNVEKSVEMLGKLIWPDFAAN